MPNIKLLVFASVSLSGLATSVILPILAPLIRQLQLSETQGGWMVSIGSVAMAVLAAFWGTASDRIGRRPIMLIGFGGLFLSYIAYTFVVGSGLAAAMTGTTLFILLVVTRALVGVFLPAVPAAAQALMADHTSAKDRASGMAIISAASGVGLVVGPALGGLLALQGLIWPLVLTTALCFIAFFVVFFAIPKTPPRLRETVAPINPLSPSLLPWLAAGVLTMCGIVTVQISAGFYFQDTLGLTTAETGPLLAIALTMVGVALFFTQIVQVKFLRWQARPMIIAGALAWMAGLVLILSVHWIGAYFLAYGLLGIGSGFLLPGYMSGASLAVPSDRQGAVGGFAAATQGIGGIIAPIASTSLYEIDRALPFWIILALMVAIVAYFALTARTAKAATP